jgi:hypothetical protein
MKEVIMKKHLILLLLLPVFLLTSCSRTQVGWIEMNYGNTFEASYRLFDGEERERIQIDAGDTLSLSYDLNVKDGALSLQFVNPDGDTLWEETFLEDGEGVFDFTAEASGRYTLVVAGDNTEGNFDLSWEISE